MESIRLRDVTVDDLDTIFDFEQDEEVVRRINIPTRSRERFTKHWHGILADDECMAKAVEVDGELAGNVVSWTQDGDRMTGYVFGRRFWGRGVGTAAMRLYLDVESVRPLYADPSSGNPASIRLLEKCGFQRIGTELVPDHHGAGQIEHVMLRLD